MRVASIDYFAAKLKVSLLDDCFSQAKPFASWWHDIKRTCFLHVKRVMMLAKSSAMTLKVDTHETCQLHWLSLFILSSVPHAYFLRCAEHYRAQ